MDIESFLIEMAESEAYQKIAYKRLSIGMFIGLYFMMKPEKGCIDPFMIPFRDFIKEQICEKQIDLDALLKYMIENDQSHSSVFLAATLFKRKSELSENEFFNAIAKYKIITPFTEMVDLDVLALIVVSFVCDNLYDGKLDIREIVDKEDFIYPINQYGLTKVNGATVKRDGLIFDGKGYFYNVFTNKILLDQYDKMAGFAKIIHNDTGDCDILYRIDERLSVPENEYHDYTGVGYARYRGPQFDFQKCNLDGEKPLLFITTRKHWTNCLW